MLREGKVCEMQIIKGCSSTKKREYLINGFLALIAVIIFLGILGTLNSGYHLADDHQFYEWNVSLKENGLWKTIVNILGEDMNIRFRPLYIVLRVVGIWFLGTNFFAWSLVKAVEIAGAFWVLYIFAREMNINKVFSYIFALLILWGEQSAIWWRLGPQESLGILLFALGMLGTIFIYRNKTIYTSAFFIVVLTLLSLQKEAFCVCMPAFFLLLLSLESSNEQGDFIPFFLSFLKKYFREIVTLLIVFVIDVYMIVFVVGTDKIGYAGFYNETSISAYIKGILENFKSTCLPYILLLIGAILLIQITIKSEEIRCREKIEILFCCYIFGTMQLSHAKSGMMERYLIPWVISVAYFVIIFGYRVMMKNKKVLLVMGEMCAMFLIYFSALVVSAGQNFAERGENLEICIEHILEHTTENESILAMTWTREEDMSISTIMREEHGYKNCDELSAYKDEAVDIGKADILFGYRGQVYPRITEESGLFLEDYNFFETEKYIVGIRKESIE